VLLCDVLLVLTWLPLHLLLLDLRTTTRGVAPLLLTQAVSTLFAAAACCCCQVMALTAIAYVSVLVT
jgi:hypothetical protein